MQHAKLTEGAHYAYTPRRSGLTTHAREAKLISTTKVFTADGTGVEVQVKGLIDGRWSSPKVVPLRSLHMTWEVLLGLRAKEQELAAEAQRKLAEEVATRVSRLRSRSLTEPEHYCASYDGVLMTQAGIDALLDQ